MEVIFTIDYGFHDDVRVLFNDDTDQRRHKLGRHRFPLCFDDFERGRRRNRRRGRRRRPFGSEQVGHLLHRRCFVVGLVDTGHAFGPNLIRNQSIQSQSLLDCYFTMLYWVKLHCNLFSIHIFSYIFTHPCFRYLHTTHTSFINYFRSFIISTSFLKINLT